MSKWAQGKARLKLIERNQPRNSRHGFKVSNNLLSDRLHKERNMIRRHMTCSVPKLQLICSVETQLLSYETIMCPSVPSREGNGGRPEDSSNPHVLLTQTVFLRSILHLPCSSAWRSWVRMCQGVGKMQPGQVSWKGPAKEEDGAGSWKMNHYIPWSPMWPALCLTWTSLWRLLSSLFACST